MNHYANLLESVAAAVADSTFDRQRESARTFINRMALSPDQADWAGRQRLIGQPSFARLQKAMHLAGLLEVSLRPADHRDTFGFSFAPGPDVTAQTANDLMRVLIRACWSAGFDIGWEDLCFTGVVGERIEGLASTTSVNDGPPEPWQLPAGS